MTMSAQETWHALSLLNGADHLRLLQAAEPEIAGTRYAAPEELVADALAAAAQGGRPWRRGEPFMQYLLDTLRRVAADAQRAP